jgi:predicted PurR-regulated permease PerM
MTKQILLFGTAVMTTLFALVIAWEFRLAIVYVLVSLIVAAALRPLANRLIKHGIVMRVVWGLVYIGMLLGFIALLFLTVKAAVTEIQQLTLKLSKQDEWVLPSGLKGSLFQQMVVTRLKAPKEIIQPLIGDQDQLELPVIVTFTQGLADVAQGMFVILLLSIYWTVSQTHFERLWLSLLPATQRKQTRDIWRTIEPEMGAYVRGLVIQGLLVGVLLSLGYRIIGSDYPVSLALAGVLASLIPVIGGALAVIPPLLIGFLTNFPIGIFTALYTIIIFIILGRISPRLFKRSWDNPISTLVIFIALANVFGLLGVIIAPPIAAVSQILWNYLINFRMASGSTAQISDIKERQEKVWTTIRSMDDPAIPLVTNSMERLTQLIEKSQPVLEDGLPEAISESVIPGEINNA